jgi:hypothetical protein
MKFKKPDPEDKWLKTNLFVSFLEIEWGLNVALRWIASGLPPYKSAVAGAVQRRRAAGSVAVLPASAAGAHRSHQA